MDDKQIIQLLWQRAESALHALARRFGPGLYRLARNILTTPADAEEAVNDTYFAIWNAIPPATPDPLAGYVFRIGRNTALKHLRNNTARKRDSRYDVSLDELSDCICGYSLGDTIDCQFLGQAIDRFLDTQSPQNRVIFLRRYWFGDSVREIAVLYAITPGNVSVRLSRLREALRTYLQEEGFLL